jgi:hypothetical protein
VAHCTGGRVGPGAQRGGCPFVAVRCRPSGVRRGRHRDERVGPLARPVAARAGQCGPRPPGARHRHGARRTGRAGRPARRRRHCQGVPPRRLRPALPRARRSARRARGRHDALATAARRWGGVGGPRVGRHGSVPAGDHARQEPAVGLRQWRTPDTGPDRLRGGRRGGDVVGVRPAAPRADRSPPGADRQARVRRPAGARGARIARGRVRRAAVVAAHARRRGAAARARVDGTGDARDRRQPAQPLRARAGQPRSARTGA